MLHTVLMFLNTPTKLLFASAVGMLLLYLVGRVPLGYNLRNLSVRWKTTVMTALAFTAVIGLLTVMLAFVNGMKKLTDGSGRVGNVLILADGATDEAFSNIATADIAQLEQLPEVLRDGDAPLASRETYMIVNQPIANTKAGRPSRRFLQVRGIEDALMASRVHELPLFEGGEWFSDAGVEALGAADGGSEGKTAIQAVLGEGVAGELGRDRTPEQLAKAKNPQRLDVGDLFELGNKQWIVKGILKSSGTTFNSEIWAKRSLCASLFGKNAYTTLILRTKGDPEAKRFKEMLKGYGKVAITPHVETEYYANLSELTSQYVWAIGFLAAIMSIGGICGVMNTMFAAITQRMKDIGVLRLLGFSRGQILVSFLLESLAIALLGGLLGCAVGWLFSGVTVTSVVTGHAGGGKSVVFQLAVDADICFKGILLTLVMGLLGGILPAFRAVRLQLLKTLR